MARKAEQGALQYAASVTEVNPPRIGGAGFISGVFNDFLANPRLPFNRLTPIGRWLGYFWDSKVAPLALNFADGTDTLDSRITFSRSSNATVTDSSGNIVYAPHNLLPFASQFDNAAWTKTATTVTANTAVAPSGQTTADKLAASGGATDHVIDEVSGSVSSGMLVTLSVYAKASECTEIRVRLGSFGAFAGSPQAATFTLTGSGSGVISQGSPAFAIEAVGNGWYRCSISATTIATGTITARYSPSIGGSTTFNADGSGVFIWGAQLNQGSLQPFYTTTVMNLLGFSEAFENAAWTKSNSFIQTNLLTFSEQFDNAAWGKSNVTISANATLAPNGTATADKLQETAVTNFFAVDRNPSGAFSTTYTWSCYAKASERNFLSFNFSVVNVSGTFNLTTGQTTILAGSPILSATPVGNGWFRCTATFTTPASGSNILYHIVGIGLSASVVSYAGTAGSGIFVWGAQLVQGASAGDYVQTTSTALPVMYQAPNGTMTADKLVEDTANAAHYVRNATVAVLANTPITVSCYARQADANRHFSLIHETSGLFGGSFPFSSFNLNTGTVVQQSGGTATITAVGNGWYRCSFTVTPTSSGNAAIQFRLQNATTVSNPLASYAGDGTSGIYIWGAQLSDSASLDPYVNNPVAAPSSTAFYGPRFDYDPVTRQPRGLLIEEARTNLLLRSEEFDNASWTKARATISQNVAISPDGTQDADKLVEDTTASNTHLTRQVVTVSANTTYTYSVYLKASERTTAFIQSSDNATDTNGFFVTVNLSNGTLSGGNKKGSGTFTSSAISNVGNGWYRVSITGIVDTTTTSVRYEVFLSDGTSTAYTGNGTSGLFVWGAQLEAGAFPTSYIPTTTATVTRAADVAVIQGTNFSSWYKYDEGTIFSEYAPEGLRVGYVSSIDDGTANNFIALGITATNRFGRIDNNGVTQANPNFSSATINTFTKGSLAYAFNNVAGTYDGATVVTDTSSTNPTVTSMRIGSLAGSSTFQFSGWIRRINYYSRRLDNSQLQAITQ